MNIPDLNLGGGAGLHGDEAILLDRAIRAIADEYTVVVTGGASAATLTATGLLATDVVKSAIYYDNAAPNQIDVTADTVIAADDVVTVAADTSDGNVVIVARRTPGA